MNKYRKVNYNFLVIVVIGILIFSMFTTGLLVIQNIMYYKTNFAGVNQTVTQTVNIDNNQKEDLEKININDCSEEALDSLPGIGKTKSSDIIKGRPYKDIYELKKVIGDITFNKIKRHITV